MGVKQELYMAFLKREGYVPEALENGDVRFKIQGEIFVITAAEDDPNYFKLSYYHAWSPGRTQQVWPFINALNAKFKVVKVSALNEVLCLTTETFLKEPADFEVLFGRCVQMINVCKNQLSADLAQSAAPMTV
jgi:hypothetical protein